MTNYPMQRMLKEGEAIDISGCPREGKYYILARERNDMNYQGMDYCDAQIERWVWSIGVRKSDGVTLASLDNDLYQNPDFDCLWLR